MQVFHDGEVGSRVGGGAHVLLLREEQDLVGLVGLGGILGSHVGILLGGYVVLLLIGGQTGIVGYLGAILVVLKTGTLEEGVAGAVDIHRPGLHGLVEVFLVVEEQTGIDESQARVEVFVLVLLGMEAHLDLALLIGLTVVGIALHHGLDGTDGGIVHAQRVVGGTALLHLGLDFLLIDFGKLSRNLDESFLRDVTGGLDP